MNQPTQGFFDSTTVRREGRGSLTYVGDIRVLRVKGSFYEMGRQHGVLLADDVRRGPIPYFRTMVEKLVGKQGLGPLAPLVWGLLQRTLGRRVEKGLPDFALDTIRGIADGAGLPFDVMLAGCTMPDSLMWVAARGMQLRGYGPAVSHRLQLGLGCTSALAWGEATTDGALLHSRNLDYHGVGVWPATKAVIFHEPEAGQRYVSVAAAGVGLGGVTAMNEAGLTLTVHQHMFTDRTALGGTAIGVVGDIVMRQAESLDDAEKILAAHKPIGCWTYLVGDGKRRQALVYEENPERHVSFRYGPERGSVGYANIYLDPELGRTEINMHGSYWRHNQGRHRIVNQRLLEQRGKLDPQAMAELMGDVGDPRCRVRESIAMALTVATVVFRPEDGSLWVAGGEAPTSHNTFAPFRLADEGPAADLPTFEGGRSVSAEDRAAFTAYRQAYCAYLDDDDPVAAGALMDQARSLAPTQPLYHFARGLLALQAGQTPTALDAFTAALELGHPDVERLAAFHLWRGRAHDLLGDRRAAESEYRLALGHHADPPVFRAAQRGLRRTYRLAQARNLHIEAALADVIDP